MRKIWTVAWREYGAMVATKAFLISILLMPVLMFGGAVVAGLMSRQTGGGVKTIAVVDGTGGALLADLRSAVEGRNSAVEAASAAGGSSAPRYELEQIPGDAIDDDQRMALSERVRNEQLAGFAEIPAGVFDLEPPGGADPQVRFYAQNAMISPEKQWLNQAIDASVTAHRLKQLDLDPALVGRATASVPFAALGLFKRAADGSVQGADPNRGMAGILLPMGFMMLMLMVLMLSAQPLIEGVMEEKSGRIAEMLLGSVNSFQLMLGKLLGNIGGSLSVVAIYAAGGLALAMYKGWTDMIPLRLMPWFVVYQVLAVLFFGSIFLAVGAAVSQLKEAQSLLLPVWLLMCMPMFTWFQMVREPNGRMATGMSFFPPSAPMTMVLRLASESRIPQWQIALSVIILVASVAAGTFFAGRIFRIGMLWQGKTPKLKELLQWGLRG